jgi:hypothetical protein
MVRVSALVHTELVDVNRHFSTGRKDSNASGERLLRPIFASGRRPTSSIAIPPCARNVTQSFRPTCSQHQEPDAVVKCIEWQ